MAVDLGDFFTKYGIDPTLGKGVNNAALSYQAPKEKPRNFFENVAHSIGTLGSAAVHGIADATTEGITGLTRNIRGNLALGGGWAGTPLAGGKYRDAEARNQALIAKQNDITKAYKLGQLSKADYQKALKGLLDEGEQSSREFKDLAEGYAGYGEVAKHAAQAGATVLTVAAPFAAAATGGTGLVANIASKVEALPGAAKIIKSAEGTLAAGKGAKALLGAPVRNALVTQPTIEQPGQFLHAVQSGDAKEIAYQAGLTAAPYLIGKASQYIPKLAQGLREAALGVRSFVDEVPTADVPIGKFLATLAPDSKEAKRFTDIAKVFQQYNLDQSSGHVDAALSRYVDWLGRGVEAKNLTAKQHLEFFEGFVKDMDKLRKAAKEGKLLINGEKLTDAQIKNLWPGRFDQADRSDLVKNLKIFSTPEQRIQVAKQLADGEAWGQNPNLKEQIIRLAGQDDFEKQINKVFAGRSLSYDAQGARTAEVVDRVLNTPSASVTLLSKASPRYNYGSKAFTLSFGDDTAKALYIVANDKSLSKNDKAFMAYLRERFPGMSDAEIRAKGAQLKDKIKAQAKALDGGVIEVPASSTIPASFVPNAVKGISHDSLTAKAINKNLKVPRSNEYKLNEGRIPILRDNVKVRPVSAAQAGELIAGKEANPILGAIAKGAKKIGLGIEDYNPQTFIQAKTNFIKKVEDAGVAPGKLLYKKLTKLADDKQITDLRLLKLDDIRSLGYSSGEAKFIQRSLLDSSLEVKTSLRGLGDRVQDVNLRYNPLSRSYARLQGKMRYSANPIFQQQQRIEAGTLGRAYTGGHVGKFDVESTINEMKAAGLFKDKNFAGETLEDTQHLTSITTHLNRGEQKELARVIDDIAKQGGQTVKEVLQDNQTREILRAVVQYPQKGIISSNAAKALNLALFPSRYNAKVLMVAAKALAKQPAAVQFAVAKDIVDFKRFLGTDEGIKWQSDNSELLGLVSYFTPINSIQQIYNGIANKDVREFGLIGGLPFGIITRVLEDEGVVPKTQPPYIDPKTGKIMNDKIPNTTKAQLQVAVKDLIDSVFTFPGRRAGLGRKSDLIDTLTGGYLKPSPKEVTSVDRSGELTPYQKRVQEVLKNNTPQPKVITAPSITPATITSPKAPPIVPIYKGSKRSKPRAKHLGEKF